MPMHVMQVEMRRMQEQEEERSRGSNLQSPEALRADKAWGPGPEPLGHGRSVPPDHLCGGRAVHPRGPAGCSQLR